MAGKKVTPMFDGYIRVPLGVQSASSSQALSGDLADNVL